jgi:hypothetical protein
MRRDQILTPDQMKQTPEPPSLLEKLRQSLTDPKQYAVLGAEWRHGLKDLQAMVLDPFPNGFPSRDEPGTIGSPTQAIVTQEIQGREAPDIDI